MENFYNQAGIKSAPSLADSIMLAYIEAFKDSEEYNNNPLLNEHNKGFSKGYKPAPADEGNKEYVQKFTNNEADEIDPEDLEAAADFFDRLKSQI